MKGLFSNVLVKLVIVGTAIWVLLMILAILLEEVGI